MAEETQHASITAPRGIIMTCVITAVMGYVYFIALLYAMQGKIQDVVRGGEGSNAIINVFLIAFTREERDS